MHINFKTFIIAGIFILAFIFVSRQIKLPNEKKDVQKNTTSDIDSKCTEGALHINQLEDVVKNNPVALSVVKNNCLWVHNIQQLDVTGDDKDELIINTSNAGCANCHERTIYILEGDNVIFERQGDDLQIDKTEFPIVGFQIKEPLRRYNEAMSSPTEGIVSTYSYSTNNDNVKFTIYDARSEEY